MNINRIGKTTALLLLLGSLTAPASLVQAKTYEDVPTAESSILSRTADPIRVSQERLKQAETEDSEEKTEETTEELIKETETTESSEEKEKESTNGSTKESSTDSSIETTDSSKEKEKKKQPRATFLIEGAYGSDDPNTYEIDKTFSQKLRTSVNGGVNPPGGASLTTQFFTNPDFSGRGKSEGELSFEDMETLTYIVHKNYFQPAFKGIEFATNLFHLMIPAPAMIGGPTFSGEGLDLSKNINLQFVSTEFQPLQEFRAPPNIEILLMRNQKLKHLDLSNCTKLKQCTLYTDRTYGVGILEELLLENCISLDYLMVYNQNLKSIDVSDCVNLNNLAADGNRIVDITSANGISTIKGLGFSSQTILVPVPEIKNGEAVIDILKTTAQKGLSATNGNITGGPTFTIDGDKILIKNVSRVDLNQRYLNFTYDQNQLVEGGTLVSGKRFSGKIEFYIISDLKNELKVDKKKIESGKKTSWTWNIESLTEETAKSVKPTLSLPTRLALVPGSIKVGGVSVSDTALDGATSLGNLATGDKKEITFETTATGNVEQWLEATGKLDWEDTTMSSPHDNESKDSIQIKDGEQTYTPKPSEEMGILSVPVRFDYGIKDMSNTTQSFGLSPDLYQTNTNVVTNGFYTRVKDDRSTSTGWSLTAQLSSFVDVNDNSRGMPDSHGTALRLEDMSIEAIKDRDTPDEAVDPAPANPPGTVKSSETIVAGQSAKTLVSAQPYTGQGTWQLRIPFNKVFLDLPANAGKERSNFQAKLTWSLNDTP
ncbi:WxL domain-containing protein [Enterococcus sp. AZ196]|uniref:WxL domain-containing protein n=1 Tax=Enterococcus sp. AZ196 TaxID=2774659 RepID=UPI003D2B3952